MLWDYNQAMIQIKVCETINISIHEEDFDQSLVFDQSTEITALGSNVLLFFLATSVWFSEEDLATGIEGRRSTVDCRQEKVAFILKLTSKEFLKSTFVTF